MRQPSEMGHNHGETTMNKLDRLIRRAGGVLIRQGAHRYYSLFGERLTVHNGTKIDSQHEKSIRERIRRILQRRGGR